MIFNQFKKRIKKLLRKKSDNFVRSSFSQSGEDLIIKFIFQTLRIKNPTYIDIGAHHPFHISNTFLFYKDGARGINIEPDQVLFKEFTECRKEDINLNIGIGASNSEMEFFLMSASTLNTFSRKDAEGYINEGNYKIKDVKKVEVRKLNDIIRDYSNNIFPQFLNIDAEGVDEIIIDSIDFEKSYPIVICIETISFSTKGLGLKNENLISKIKAKGYFLYADTYINSIFVSKPFWDKAFKH